MSKANDVEILPVAVWEGKVNIGPVELDCYVLDNGKRIISEDSMIRLFEWMETGDVTKIDMTGIASFCKGSGIPTV